MSIQRKLLWIIVIQLISIAPLTSSNFHEHLFSVPFEQNFSPTISKVIKGELKVTTGKVFKSEEQWDFIFDKVGSSKIKGHYHTYKGCSLDTVTRKLTTQQISLLFSAIFRTKNYQLLSTKERKIAYQINENLRKEIFLNAPLDDVLHIFREYLEQEPIEN